jgi:pimeloyl-ACP methyl ester carboxylesterase
MALLILCSCHQAQSDFIPRDVELRREPLYFYPNVAGEPTKAAIFFFGNDLGFWEPHQKLARRLSRNGYAVVGFDVKRFLDRLPDSDAVRDSVLAHEVPNLVVRSFKELNAGHAPVIVGGHSFGADLALWTEAHASIPGVIGLLALGPTKRDHPRVTLNDKINFGEPTEPGSFAVVDEIRREPANVRIALLRGAGDKERREDPSFVAAGGNRIEYTVIPFASHSLKSLIIAGPMIEKAIEDLLARR